MNGVSEKMISVEEAKAALRCMRLSGLDEEEALESMDDFVFRIRDITMAGIVEDIIKNEITPAQYRVMKLYLYDGMTPTEIGRSLGISQSTAYNTIARVNSLIARLLSPLIKYLDNLNDVTVTPLLIGKLYDICASRKSEERNFCTKLKNLRLSYAISEESLAKNLRISQRELYDIESGRKIPSLTVVMRYSALFEVEINMNFKNGKGVYVCRKP